MCQTLTQTYIHTDFYMFRTSMWGSPQLYQFCIALRFFVERINSLVQANRELNVVTWSIVKFSLIRSNTHTHTHTHTHTQPHTHTHSHTQGGHWNAIVPSYNNFVYSYARHSVCVQKKGQVNQIHPHSRQKLNSALRDLLYTLLVN